VGEQKKREANMARVAVVTGGTRGIGAAISKALEAAGYKVAANYGGNDEAAAKFKADTGIPVYKWDVSSFEACSEGIAKVEAELGPIEILVNNAGITRDAMLHRMKPEQWKQVIDTNLGSLFNMCRPVIEGMRTRKFGRIVNISSINGQKGQMGQTNYSAAKAGDIGFTKALAQEMIRRPPSTRSAPATSTRRWCRRCRRTCWRKTSCRRFRSAASARPTKLRAASSSSSRTMPA
jgi:acetoacetyl-CoA reductase